MINLTNNTNQKIYIYLCRDGDLHQIAFLEPGRCTIQSLQKGEIIHCKLSETIENVQVPTKTFKMKTIQDENIILIQKI